MIFIPGFSLVIHLVVILVAETISGIIWLVNRLKSLRSVLNWPKYSPGNFFYYLFSESGLKKDSSEFAPEN